ncbi:polyprenyl synthetase family protein [Paenibacillus sp. J2TS4]|uniref:polyprenyl synthetase family protein n=1 Tax=Paenibacillus sp. J2TS4 TaxID=2807194 RepID=UPI001BCF3EB4|nr:farnesyl diphosphate synthase [Paenibacillus sp. J2TS4]
MEASAALIESELRRSIPEHGFVPAPLREAAMYSLLAGGKRLRPIFVLAAVEALGGEAETALPVACAVEMIHTYSLIHDDLPAMDNDDYRRGKPTNHKVFGEAMAILAGDALLTHAFYTASQVGRSGQVPADRALAIIEEMAKLAGFQGMVGGQVADMLGEQGLTRKEELDNIHRHKTGDLIVFSLKAGGIIGGATPDQLSALERFGYSIGLAFQIQDDILDITGDETKLGKPVNSDEQQRKVTYPYFIGLEASMKRVELLTDEGIQAIMSAGFPQPQRLKDLAEFLMRREY